MSLLDRVLIIGATGQLGSALMETFTDCGPIAPTHAEMDVEEYCNVRNIFNKHRPTLVINTSAFHRVDDCETQPPRAFSINSLAVDHLALACASVGAALAHISTDYVFDGKSTVPYDESDLPAPLNVYGLSKFVGEQLLARHDIRYYVFRTSGLFGKFGTSNKGVTFIERMLRGAEKNERQQVVNDTAFSPSYAPHVAQSMREIMSVGVSGTYHVTNTGACTWYEFAVGAVAAAGLNTSLIVPIQSVQILDPWKTRRPKYSVLGHGAIERGGFKELPSISDAVSEYVEARSSDVGADAA